MLRTPLSTLRSGAAVIAGYAVIVAGTVLVLEVILGGISYAEANAVDHAVGAVGTILSGLAAGYATAWLAGRMPLVHAGAVVAILIAEMTWILTQGIGPNPAWFDALGGATLMITTLIGAWIHAIRTESRSRPAVA